MTAPSFPIRVFDAQNPAWRDVQAWTLGAHLTHFRDWLWVSPQFAEPPEVSEAIRGGVPICFPWFADHRPRPDAPSHGFVRTEIWDVVDAKPGFDATLRLASDGTLSPHWPHPFRARMSFGVGDSLKLRFEVENTGDASFQFECALHSYYAVSNVRDVIIEGLGGATVLDKLDNFKRKIQRDPLPIDAAIDAVHLGASGPIRIRTPQRTLQIQNVEGWRSTIVWNPGEESGSSVKGVEDEWNRFICVECGAVHDDAVKLAPGEDWALEIEISAR